MSTVPGTDSGPAVRSRQVHKSDKKDRQKIGSYAAHNKSTRAAIEYLK